MVILLLARFQSTPPGWEATLSALCSWSIRSAFQSTPPGWEATISGVQPSPAPHHFNPRLPGGRRHRHRIKSVPQFIISIHVSRVGGDAEAIVALFAPHISIHASRVGGDPAEPQHKDIARLFQSTPPGWEATIPQPSPQPVKRYFNPRLPGGRRPEPRAAARPPAHFNPRLPGGRRQSTCCRSPSRR